MGPLLLHIVMKKQFYLLLSLKTAKGFETYGQYFLGEDRTCAESVFTGLKGATKFNEQALLHLDLMETINELPVKVKTKCCTLEELGDNCKWIAKETFRLLNLEE